MLSDRSYMRGDPHRQSPSVLAWLLGILVGVFVLQNVFQVWFPALGAEFLYDWLALSGPGLREGKVWTVLTYVLLHGGIGHLLANGLGIFFFGRELQATLGAQRFLRLIFAGSIGGGLLWAAVNFSRGGMVIGASGLAMAFLAVFACLYPWRRITILLFFILPVTVQPMWLAAVLAGIDVFGLLFAELPNGGSLYGVAHSAHLGGFAAGWLFYQLVLARNAEPDSAPAIEPPAWFKRRAHQPAPAYQVNLTPPNSPSPRPAQRDNLRAEVDRILDKINLHGFGSLTEEEKRVLDEARRHLNPNPR